MVGPSINDKEEAYRQAVVYLHIASDIYRRDMEDVPD
jgi:hypothetical protein